MMGRFSIHVSKSGILPIRPVRPSISFAPLTDRVHGRLDAIFLIFSMVGEDIVQEQKHGQKCPSRLGSQNGDLGRDVLRGVLALEGLWSDDVTHREGTSNESAGHDSFGLPGAVGDGPLVDDDESCYNRVHQVNAGQESGLVALLER